MNTRHFSGNIKPIPQQACGPVERASSREPVQDAQSTGSAVRHALLLWESELATFRYWLSRLRDCKSQRCGERSEGGAEGGAYRWKKKSLHPALGARQRRI